MCIRIHIKYILSHFFKKPPPRQRQIESRAFFAVLQVWFILLILNGLKYLQKTIQPHKLVATMSIPRFVVAPKISLRKISQAFNVVSPSSYTTPIFLHPLWGFLCIFLSRKTNLPNLFFSRATKIPRFSVWVFPKLGVPQNGWFIMENPIKMDDLGGKPTIFGNTRMWCPNFESDKLIPGSARPTPKNPLVGVPPHLVPPLETWAESARLTLQQLKMRNWFGNEGCWLYPDSPYQKKNVEAFLCWCCEKKWCQYFFVASNFIQINKIWKQWNKDVLQVLDVLELIMEDIGLFLMGESMVGAKRRSFFTRELWLWEESIVHSPWKMVVGRQLSYLNFRGVIIQISWSQIGIFFGD